MEESLLFCCPHCLQHSACTISLISGRQEFVEDCQICCEPIQFLVEVRDGEVTRMEYDLAS